MVVKVKTNWSWTSSQNKYVIFVHYYTIILSESFV